jgi:hypothetical protein
MTIFGAVVIVVVSIVLARMAKKKIAQMVEEDAKLKESLIENEQKEEKEEKEETKGKDVKDEVKKNSDSHVLIKESSTKEDEENSA